MDHFANRWFWLGCLFELLLGVMALLLGYLLDQPIASMLSGDVRALSLGCAATIPLLIFFRWLLASRLPWIQQMNEFFARIVKPLFGQWSLAQLALVSILAGVGEEMLFRGVIQVAVASAVGPATGLLIASLLFGAAHWITPGYGIIAALMGLYLGGLWLWSGNLMVPIVTHAAYDFLALIYLLRIWNPETQE